MKNELGLTTMGLRWSAREILDRARMSPSPTTRAEVCPGPPVRQFRNLRAEALACKTLCAVLVLYGACTYISPLRRNLPSLPRIKTRLTQQHRDLRARLIRMLPKTCRRSLRSSILDSLCPQKRIAYRHLQVLSSPTLHSAREGKTARAFDTSIGDNTMFLQQRFQFLIIPCLRQTQWRPPHHIL